MKRSCSVGRPATDKELAEHVGIRLQVLWRWQLDTAAAVHVPLDRTTTDSNGHTQQALDALANEAGASPIDEDVCREQDYQILRGALFTLNERERIVVTLYYFEELKLHEIGDVLGLTESRISQIRAKALGRLRLQLAGLRQQVA